jgi:hypothetical protein
MESVFHNNKTCNQKGFIIVILNDRHCFAIYSGIPDMTVKKQKVIFKTSRHNSSSK